MHISVIDMRCFGPKRKKKEERKRKWTQTLVIRPLIWKRTIKIMASYSDFFLYAFILLLWIYNYFSWYRGSTNWPIHQFPRWKRFFSHLCIICADAKRIVLWEPQGPREMPEKGWTEFCSMMTVENLPSQSFTVSAGGLSRIRGKKGWPGLCLLGSAFFKNVPPQCHFPHALGGQLSTVNNALQALLVYSRFPQRTQKHKTNLDGKIQNNK